MANIKTMIEDYKMVLKEARDMGCKDIRALYNIPLDNFETIISALEMKDKHETQRIDDTNNLLDH